MFGWVEFDADSNENNSNALFDSGLIDLKGTVGPSRRNALYQKLDMQETECMKNLPVKVNFEEIINKELTLQT